MENSIIIFDEAHNIENTAEEGSSLSLNSVEMKNAFDMLKNLVKAFKQFPTKKRKFKNSKKVQLTAEQIKKTNLDLEKTQLILGTVKRFKDFLHQYGKSKVDITFQPNPQLLELISQGTKKKSIGIDNFLVKPEDIWWSYEKGITMENIDTYCQQLEGCIDLIEASSLAAPGLRKWLDLLSTMKWLFSELKLLKKEKESRTKISINHYYVSIYFNKLEQLVTLQLLCMSPHVCFHRIKNHQPRSIFLTSGTLTPIESFELEMGIQFKIKLVNDHIIKDEQLLSGILKTGPLGRKLNFSFNHRDDEDMINDLGKAIIALSKRVRGGILIFFASYGLMSNVK